METQRSITKLPLPPFTHGSAELKVRFLENAWNSRDPEKVALAYATSSQCRNHSEFVNGRQEIVGFFTLKRSKEEYRLIKELCAFRENWIAVPFAYEWPDDSLNWFRSYGNENWEFDKTGSWLDRRRALTLFLIGRLASRIVNIIGRLALVPDQHPCLSELGL
jgi:nuclear transport factor 2 (NTF2) superfamily protein